jgi:hypothetical protein
MNKGLKGGGRAGALREGQYLQHNLFYNLLGDNKKDTIIRRERK